MANNKSFKVKNGLELQAYNKAIADTAVDVFVYDTRKDSDGGAWRNRTQGTSWYNETLNTATRGSRKEFPAVAVIVVTSAEQTSIMIYDGDDPDLPLWMSFNRVYTNGGYTLAYYTAPTAVSALNGIISFGSNLGVGTINFVADNSYRRRSAGGDVAGYYLSGIADRNVGSGFETNNDTSIVNNTVNDVAMTVLPNAPIDAATGLPVPTIAVATDGGVSVIKDDNTVVDITTTSGASGWGKSNFVAFRSDNKIVSTVGYSSNDYSDRYVHINTIPNADFSLGNGLDNVTSEGYHGATGGDIAIVSVLGEGSDKDITSMTAEHFGQASGLSQVAYAPIDTAPDLTSMVAYTTSDYNTGWMNGDIKLATLSDTDTTNVTGSELVTNGTFDSNISGWTASDAGCSLSLVSNQLRITNNDATAGGAVTSFSVVSGKVYTFNVGTSSKDVWLYLGNAPNNGTYFAGIVSNSHTWTSTVTGTVYFMVKNSVTTNGDTVDIDNVSVRLAEEDRSVNVNGLQVFGTVTKSAVATGADLVAYSGFSTSNYLEQPYNSDLDFGTGDFCVMGWFKTSSLSSDEVIFNRSDDGLTGVLLEIRTDSAGDKIRVFTGSSGYNGLVNFYSSTITTNTWNLISLVRTGSSISIHINGQLGTSSTSTQDLTNASAKARVGIRYLSGAYSLPLTNGALALWRISATAPSPEQIKKIYEDEKFLFQENAKATLYGSSDAVTALAYDDSTELLHVGTSAGRSDFQGLRRVNNTTTAVGSAISASNGLIADD